MTAFRAENILCRPPSKMMRVALVIVILFAGFASLLLEKHHSISVDDASVQAALHSSGESDQPDHSTTAETHHCQLAHFLGVTVERETGSGLPSGKFGPILLNRPSGRIDAPTHQPPRA